MARPELVHVIDVDPDLGRDLDAASERAAREQLVARVEPVPAGRREGTWGPPDPRGHIGLLLVAGLMLREVAIGRTRSTELLGAPDLLQPWGYDGGVNLPFDSHVSWEILSESRVAVLDAAFTRRASAWPTVMAALAARGVRRAKQLAVHQAIAHLHRVDERLLLLFWHLAERWGRVTRDGVVVDLPLTHDLLARLVGAQRPSVTTALGDLRRRGAIDRRPNRTWVLRREAAGTVEAKAGSEPSGPATVPG